MLGYSSFEVELIQNIETLISTSSGLGFLAYSAEYTVFVILQLAFFVRYFSRALKLIFLVMISPFMGVMHVYGKLTGKPDNYIGRWLSMLIMLLVTQPMHAFFYLCFLFAVSEIATIAPLFAMIMLYALWRSDKILEAMLGINTGKLSSLLGNK